MLSLLSKISMGCMCSRETIEVDGHTYSIRSRLGEGYDRYSHLGQSHSALKFN